MSAIDPCTLDEVFSLASGGCQEPGCTADHHGQMFLHSHCHPRRPTWTMIDAATRRLVVVCSECRRPILVIDTKLVRS